jgi:hypothetical protein
MTPSDDTFEGAAMNDAERIRMLGCLAIGRRAAKRTSGFVLACAVLAEAGCSGQTFAGSKGGEPAGVNDAGAATDAGPDTGASTQMDSGSVAEAAADQGAPAVDAGPPQWNPGLIPGLALWLDGTKGLAYGPSGLAWLDQSGNGNDATPAGAPTIAMGAIGGNPAVHFNGTTDYLIIQDSASLQFSTDDFAIAMVAAHTTPLTGQWGYGLLYSKQVASAAPYIGPAIVANSLQFTGALFAQVANQSGSEIQTTEQDFNSGKPFMLVLRRTGGTTLSLRVNGADAVAATGAGYAIDVSAPGNALHIGGSVKQQDVLGDVAEVVATHGALSSTDLADLEGYLSAKYGL